MRVFIVTATGLGETHVLHYAHHTGEEALAEAKHDFGGKAVKFLWSVDPSCSVEYIESPQDAVKEKTTQKKGNCQ